MQDALGALRQRKAAVKAQMKESMDYIRNTANSLATPLPRPTSKWGSFMNMIDQGLAVYDGVMMGMRVARNIRRVFGKRK